MSSQPSRKTSRAFQKHHRPSLSSYRIGLTKTSISNILKLKSFSLLRIKIGNNCVKLIWQFSNIITFMHTFLQASLHLHKAVQTKALEVQKHFFHTLICKVLWTLLYMYKNSFIGIFHDSLLYWFFMMRIVIGNVFSCVNF